MSRDDEDDRPVASSASPRSLTGVDGERRVLLLGLLGLVGCAGRPDPQRAPEGSPLGADPDAGRLASNDDVDGGAMDAGGETPDPPDTEHCKDDVTTAVCRESSSDSEGPFYIDGAPVGDDLVDRGLQGERIVVRGVVYGADCEPLAGARLDLWHANEAGVYDNTGWTLRRVFFADACGRFSFRTILPGYFDTRPRHFHIKVRAPGHEELTTQLYFLEDPKAPTTGGRALMRLALSGRGGFEREANFDFGLVRTVPV